MQQYADSHYNPRYSPHLEACSRLGSLLCISCLPSTTTATSLTCAWQSLDVVMRSSYLEHAKTSQGQLSTTRRTPDFHVTILVWCTPCLSTCTLWVRAAVQTVRTSEQSSLGAFSFDRPPPPTPTTVRKPVHTFNSEGAHHGCPAGTAGLYGFRDEP